MRAQLTGLARRSPQRPRVFRPSGVKGRGELTAALGTAVVVGQLLFVPGALVFAAGLLATGRISRWRPLWLLLPAAVGFGWVLAIGGPATLRGFAAGPDRVAGYLAAAAARPGQLAQLPGAAIGSGRGLPIALLAGTAEAWLVLWLWRWPATWLAADGWRPGLAAALRRRIVTRALADGRTVTASGCAIGVQARTGRPVGLSWAQFEHGVLVCGSDGARLAQVCLPAVCAAIRRRKAVLVADLDGDGVLPVLVRDLARSLAVGVTDLAGGALAADLGRAIRHRAVSLIGPAAAAVGDLTAVLAGLADRELRGDTLVWIHGCEQADPAPLSEMLRLGPGTGTGLLLSTTHAATALRLAAAVAVTAVPGPMGEELAARLADLGPGPAAAGGAPLSAQPEGTFALLTRGALTRLTPRCDIVPLLPAGRG
jgi:hypothetical protein